MIQDHGIIGVYGVGLGQQLDSSLDGIWLLAVEFQDGETDQSTDTLRVQGQSAFEGHSGM